MVVVASFGIQGTECLGVAPAATFISLRARRVSVSGVLGVRWSEPSLKGGRGLILQRFDGENAPQGLTSINPTSWVAGGLHLPRQAPSPPEYGSSSCLWHCTNA